MSMTARMAAIVAALAIAGCNDRRESEQAHQRAEAVERAARQAEQAAREAQAQVEKLAHDLADLDGKLAAAVDAVMASKTDAERQAARLVLEQLRGEKLALEQRVHAARASAVDAQRTLGVRVSKECLDNPLAKGCQ